LNAPKLLCPDLSLRAAPQVLIAGQLSAVEGYVEWIATGLLAGMAMAERAKGKAFAPPSRTTALGSLVHYITHADPADYQPANISFDLLAPIDGLPRSIARDRRARRERQCERALVDLEVWLETINCPLSVARGRKPSVVSPQQSANGELF